MDIKEKINGLIDKVQEEIEEKQKQQDEWNKMLMDGTSDDELNEKYDYYDGYIDGLYRDLNDLKSLL